MPDDTKPWPAPPVVVALDQATELMGWAVAELSGRIIDAGVQRFRGERAVDRIPHAVRFAVELFDSYRARGGFVGLERTWSGKNPRTVDVLAVLRGRLWQAAADRGFDVREIEPSAWRSSVGVELGRVGAKNRAAELKRQAVRLAGLSLPIVSEVGEADMAEAILMAVHLAGMARLERARRTG